MTKPQGHSPLGASGTHRWMKCPGSVALSEGVDDPESDHALLGSAAHKVGEISLVERREPWTLMGRVYCGGTKALIDPGEKLPQDHPSWVLIDKAIADAVQVYISAVEAWHPERHQGNTWVERDFHCPAIHKYFWGTSDLVHLNEAERELHIWDYKNGAGVVVEVEGNPQLSYYACGALEDLDLWTSVDKVILHVAQPNGFHMDGPIRHWETTPSALEDWLLGTLLPAMDRALASRDTASGEHCRFCPARRIACPQIEKDMTELEAMMAVVEKAGVSTMTNEWMGRFLDLFDVAKIKAKAVNEETFNRLNKGHDVPGRKLAAAKANRAWKDGAEAAAKKEFGKQAYTLPELKSPAQIDALPKGSAFTARWAAKPDKGLTVVRAEDTRPAVSKNVKSMFKDHTQKASA